MPQDGARDRRDRNCSRCVDVVRLLGRT